LPAETAAALRDGFLYTGDIGELDSDCYLFIRDRKKDMAIVGGYNVYPREIDEVLFAHPDVLEVAAIGVPDAYRGEIIRAFVVARPGRLPSVEDLPGALPRQSRPLQGAGQHRGWSRRCPKRRSARSTRRRCASAAGEDSAF